MNISCNLLSTVLKLWTLCKHKEMPKYYLQKTLATQCSIEHCVPCGCLAGWELWLIADDQHCTSVSYHISPPQGKVLSSPECGWLLHHHKVKPLNRTICICSIAKNGINLTWQRTWMRGQITNAKGQKETMDQMGFELNL